MMNYGLDEDQENAIKWAIATAQGIMFATQDDLEAVDRASKRFIPSAPGNKEYFRQLEKNRVVLTEKLERLKKHITALKSLLGVRA